MNRQRLSRVRQAAVSWPFVLAVALLLLNDYYLKATYSNWVTGKLSDVAGLFFVSVLAFAAFPMRTRLSAGLIALTFACWKSPLSQPLIDLVVASGVARIGRVVDYSDLPAVLVMPLAHAVATKSDRFAITTPTLAKALSAPFLVVAFLATLGTTVLPTLDRYTIRKADGYGPFDSVIVARLIGDVASANGMECTACDRPATTAEYRGRGIRMNYWITDQRSVLFAVSAMPGASPNLETLRRDLKHQLGTRLTSMEFIQPLPEAK